jgi:hypothetical protein
LETYFELWSRSRDVPAAFEPERIPTAKLTEPQARELRFSYASADRDVIVLERNAADDTFVEPPAAVDEAIGVLAAAEPTTIAAPIEPVTLRAAEAPAPFAPVIDAGMPAELAASSPATATVADEPAPPNVPPRPPMPTSDDHAKALLEAMPTEVLLAEFVNPESNFTDVEMLAEAARRLTPPAAVPNA